MTKKQSKLLTARGWATVFAAVILLDDVTEVIDRPSFGFAVGVFVADLVLIVMMALALYGKRSTSEPGR